MSKEIESGEETLLLEQQARTVNLLHSLLVQNYTQIIGIHGGPYLDPQKREWMSEVYKDLNNNNVITSIINSFRNYVPLIHILKTSRSFQSLIIGISSVRYLNSSEMKNYRKAYFEANLHHIQADILITDAIRTNPDIHIHASDDMNDAAKTYKIIESANIDPQRSTINPHMANRGNAILLRIRDAPWIEQVMQSDPKQLIPEIIKQFPYSDMSAMATIRGSSWALLNITGSKSFDIIEKFQPKKQLSPPEVKKVMDTLEHFFS